MNAIVVTDKQWAIGRSGDLLFSLPGDMKRFRTVLYRMVCPVFRLKEGTFEACEEVRVTRWREA